MKSGKASKKPSYEEALQKAAALCSKSEKSGYDIWKKLDSWNVDKKHRSNIIDHLKDEGFIDEQRYAETFVREKFHLNGWGRIKLRQGLKEKRIPEGIIADALQVIDEEEYLTKLQDILRKKRMNMNEEDPLKRKAKLIRYAAGKGFEEGLVKEMIDQLLPDEMN